jgi:cold shock CspA family protein
MFVHVLNINRGGLGQGDKLEFNEEERKKGLVAANLQVL